MSDSVIVGLELIEIFSFICNMGNQNSVNINWDVLDDTEDYANIISAGELFAIQSYHLRYFHGNTLNLIILQMLIFIRAFVVYYLQYSVCN